MLLKKQTNRELNCDTLLLTEIQILFKFHTKCIYICYTLFGRKVIIRQTKILCNVFIDMIIIAWCILIPVRKYTFEIII